MFTTFTSPKILTQYPQNRPAHRTHCVEKFYVSKKLYQKLTMDCAFNEPNFFCTKFPFTYLSIEQVHRFYGPSLSTLESHSLSQHIPIQQLLSTQQHIHDIYKLLYKQPFSFLGLVLIQGSRECAQKRTLKLVKEILQLLVAKLW